MYEFYLLYILASNWGRSSFKTEPILVSVSDILLWSQEYLDFFHCYTVQFKQSRFSFHRFTCLFSKIEYTKEEENQVSKFWVSENFLKSQNEDQIKFTNILLLL